MSKWYRRLKLLLWWKRRVQSNKPSPVVFERAISYDIDQIDAEQFIKIVDMITRKTCRYDYYGKYDYSETFYEVVREAYPYLKTESDRGIDKLISRLRARASELERKKEAQKVLDEVRKQLKT